jgi:uncharacterized protein HemX
MANDETDHVRKPLASGDGKPASDVTKHALGITATHAATFVAGMTVGAAAFGTGVSMEHEAQMRKLREENAAERTQDQVVQATTPAELRQQEMKRFVAKVNAEPDKTANYYKPNIR